MINRLGNTILILKKTVPVVIADNSIRTGYTSKHGTILQEPHRTSFGIIKIFLTVIPGLLVGATISKNIANFLEENDLFVPSDDDDDDD